MDKIAYVFPGQGSQKVGMGQDLYHDYPSAKVIFQEADATLGFPLSKMCFEGPEEELRQTINAQPALVTMSFASLQAALSISERSHIPAPSYLAGHSLGEHTALLVSGALNFAQTLLLVRERGRLMQEAGDKKPGGMAAILSLTEEQVTSICLETGTWIANINCPGQIVISGTKPAVDKAIALAQSQGARAMPLQVSGAFHSPLMEDAKGRLSQFIANTQFRNPLIPIIANTNAKPLATSEAIKSELVEQLTHSVQWQRSVEYMIENGVTTFIEIGSGKVLAGLIKRINKSVKILNIGESGELKNIMGQPAQ